MCRRAARRSTEHDEKVSGTAGLTNRATRDTPPAAPRPAASGCSRARNLQARGEGVGMRCRRPKTIMLAKVTSALPITARAIVTFWFQKLIFASGVSSPSLVTFSPQLHFPGPGAGQTGPNTTPSFILYPTGGSSVVVMTAVVSTWFQTRVLLASGSAVMQARKCLLRPVTIEDCFSVRQLTPRRGRELLGMTSRSRWRKITEEM